MKPPNDERVESLIANLLRAGVLISALVVIGGGVTYLGHNPWAHVDYRTFHGEPGNLKSAHGIVRTALSGDPRGIMQLGLLLLIATPIVRVLLSTLIFAMEKDLMYLGFTLIVLAVLLYSLFGSFLIA